MMNLIPRHTLKHAKFASLVIKVLYYSHFRWQSSLKPFHQFKSSKMTDTSLFMVAVSLQVLQISGAIIYKEHTDKNKGKKN